MRNRTVTHAIFFILMVGLASALIAGLFAIGTAALADNGVTFSAVTGNQTDAGQIKTAARDGEDSSYKHLKKPFARYDTAAVG